MRQTSARFAKQLLAAALDTCGLLRADLSFRGLGAVVAVNYHGTPARFADTLESHFAFYRRNFDCLVEDDLLEFMRGSRPLRRTGIVITFDDGLRDNAEVAAPLLEAHGLRGWFLVPGDFAEQAPRDQPAYFRRHIRVQADVEHDADEDLTAMSWGAMAALLGRGHTLGCHSWSHRPLGEPIAPDTIRDEIERAREKLESRLGRRVRTFAWPRGRVDDYSIGALEAIRQTYDLAFSSMSRSIRPGDDPHLLDRFNVEASYPLEVVRFQISRINEAAFTRRRRQVRRHLGLPTSFGR